MLESKEWKHIFKLDPEKEISDENLELVCESGSDAIIVGGTFGVTFDNTIDLLARIRRYAIPCFLEVSNIEAIVPGFDHYFIPLVLNATDANWILQPHHEAIKELGSTIPWEHISTVGYTVLNPHSSVAELTNASKNSSLEDVLAYGRMAQHLLKLPFLYVEYSGAYGDVNMLKVCYQRLKREGDLHIFYGGGIRNREQAIEMSQVADTIVVGNIIYEDIQLALSTIVKNKSNG